MFISCYLPTIYQIRHLCISTKIVGPLYPKHTLRQFVRYASSKRLVKSAQPNVLKVRETTIFPHSVRIIFLRNLDFLRRIQRSILLKVSCYPFLSNLLLTSFKKSLKTIGEFNKMQVDSVTIKGSSNFAPPIAVRGMKVFDRSIFKCDIKVFGIPVPVQNGTVVTKRFKTRLLKIPKIKSIAELGDSDPNYGSHKLFLFDPQQILNVESIPESDVAFLKSLGVDSNAGKLFDVSLAYENWTYDEILDSILPEDTQGVGGFSVIGHIAHLNLKDDLLAYKQVIGDVLLDKINAVRTVVNKINIIDNTYRNFQMELLAGENNFITIAKEHGLSYEFDFSKVYWNSRLGTEHQRIVAGLSNHDVLYDVFAGVGPFAVPAAKKGCSVVANDLNPESYRWLQHNVKLNKVKGEIQLYNLDGREFIRSVVKKDLLDRWRASTDDDDVTKKSNIHMVMNLPAIAIEFLDAFRGLILEDDLVTDGLKRDALTLPIIHCYCFSKSADVVEDARRRTEESLGVALSSASGCTVRIVRNVAPNKEMLCVTFTLPLSLLISSKDCDGDIDQSDASDEPKEKKSRTS